MTDSTIDIAPIAVERLHIPIRGLSPLIVHRFSEKAKKQMLDAQSGVKTPKQKRNPEAEYEAAKYFLKDGRYGVPAMAFKGAVVKSARFFGKDVSMVLLKQTIFVRGEEGMPGHGELIAIEGEPEMREDIVRLSNGNPDLRYRPIFNEWSAIIPVTYVAASFTKGSILSLVDAAGIGVGICEWRPEKGGVHGQFEVDPTRDVEAIK